MQAPPEAKGQSTTHGSYPTTGYLPQEPSKGFITEH